MKLVPVTAHPALGDPAMTGEWALVLPGIATESAPPPWCTYLAARKGRAVGVGLFKGPPDYRNAVEIAYLTFLPAMGSSVATEIARELVRLARNAGAKIVSARTLCAPDASNRVLEKNGFALVGEMIDPDDGSVWQWELAL